LVPTPGKMVAGALTNTWSTSTVNGWEDCHRKSPVKSPTRTPAPCLEG